MRFLYVAASLLLLSCMAVGYDASLAPVRNLECSAKNATRFSQGATTQGKTGGPIAFVKIVASGVNTWGSDSQSCDVRATLHVRGADQTEKEIALGHNANADFDIVDWSPKGDLILTSSRRWVDPVAAPLVEVYNVKDKTRRSIDVASLFASEGWVHCAAIIETAGFAPDGRIVVNAGPGSRAKRPRDCASNRSYWAFDPKNPKVQQLQSDYRQQQYGRVISPEYRPCEEDPGIVDGCFTVHGRMQVWNGTPSLRIWRIGTDRILGVYDPENEIIPNNLARQLNGFETAVYGDFEVCPFTKSRPGEMQMVCVESASHLVTKHY